MREESLMELHLAQLHVQDSQDLPTVGDHLLQVTCLEKLTSRNYLNLKEKYSSYSPSLLC